MDAQYRRSWVGGSLLVLAAALGLLLAPSAGAAEPGVWQSHRMTFNYLGGEPAYSCEGLRQDLEALLKMSGARLDAPVEPGPCSGGEGQPSKLLYATLKFSTLQPLSASGAPTNAAASPSVPGDWRPVVLSPRLPGDVLQGSDCELVQEFKDTVLKYFATRDVKANLQCVPFQATGFLFSLSFKVFAPAAAAHG